MIKILQTTDLSENVRGLYRYSLLRIGVPTKKSIEFDVKKTGFVYDETTRMKLARLRSGVYKRKFII